MPYVRNRYSGIAQKEIVCRLKGVEIFDDWRHEPLARSQRLDTAARRSRCRWDQSSGTEGSSIA